MAAAGCKEKYLPNVTSPPTGYLVVEGFISSGEEPTSITLSRTSKLYDSLNILYEHNAEIFIENENLEKSPLSETGNGVYTSASLQLTNSDKYRLHIKTLDGKEYTSGFVKVKRTPEIDSVSWAREKDGVNIYVNTHDPQNNTKYYLWKFEETWEFHSTYLSVLLYLRDPTTNYPLGVDYRNPDHSPDTTIYKCWNNVISANINIGSSEKLSEDVIHLPLIYIDPASIKLSVLYSIHVRQYALSHEAYLFFQKIKKNTESLGSIFDAQPSDLQGNIHCTSDPSEIVVGYIDVSEEKQRRIFIRNSELPGWNYSMRCANTVLDNDADSLKKYGNGLYPTTVLSLGPFGGVAKFYATPEINCMDCTLRGTNKRPAFWP